MDGEWRAVLELVGHRGTGAFKGEAAAVTYWSGPPRAVDVEVHVPVELARVLGMQRAGANTVKGLAQYVVEASNWPDDILRNSRRPDGCAATAATHHYFAELGLMLCPRPSERLMSYTQRCTQAREDLPPQRWDDCLSVLLDLGLTEGAFPAGAVRDMGHHLRAYLGRESEETVRRLMRKWDDAELIRTTV